MFRRGDHQRALPRARQIFGLANLLLLCSSKSTEVISIKQNGSPFGLLKFIVIFGIGAALAYATNGLTANLQVVWMESLLLFWPLSFLPQFRLLISGIGSLYCV